MPIPEDYAVNKEEQEKLNKIAEADFKEFFKRE
jgi:hypothetical protein